MSFFACPDWKVLRCHRSSLQSCETQRDILLNGTKKSCVFIRFQAAVAKVDANASSGLCCRSDLCQQMVYRHRTSKLFIIIKTGLFTSHRTTHAKSLNQKLRLVFINDRKYGSGGGGGGILIKASAGSATSEPAVNSRGWGGGL